MQVIRVVGIVAPKIGSGGATWGERSFREAMARTGWRVDPEDPDN
jgi:hypothetical protein